VIEKQINRGGEQVHYYLCRTKVLQVAHAFKLCPSKLIKKETLEQIIWQLFNSDYYPNRKILEDDTQANKEINENKKQEINARIEEIERQIDEKEAEKVYNFRVGIRAKINHEVLESDGIKMQAEIDQLQRMIISLKSELFEIKEREGNENILKELTSKFETIGNNKEVFKIYVKKLIKRIIMYAGVENKRDIIIEITYFNDTKIFIIYNPFSIHTKEKFIVFRDIFLTYKYEFEKERELNGYNISYNHTTKKFDLLQNNEKKEEITVEQFNNLYYKNKEILIKNYVLQSSYGIVMKINNEINKDYIEMYVEMKKQRGEL
jgi:hypothetical protein